MNQPAATAPPFPTLNFKRLDTLWLQVTGTLCNLACLHCFISCGPKNDSHAFMTLEQVRDALAAAGIRVRVDDSDSTIGKKIRTHRKMRPAYMLILGDEEVAGNTVGIRARAGDQRNGVPLADFVAGLAAEVTSRSPDLRLVSGE